MFRVTGNTVFEGRGDPKAAFLEHILLLFYRRHSKTTFCIFYRFWDPNGTPLGHLSGIFGCPNLGSTFDPILGEFWEGPAAGVWPPEPA